MIIAKQTTNKPNQQPITNTQTENIATTKLNTRLNKRQQHTAKITNLHIHNLH